MLYGRTDGTRAGWVVAIEDDGDTSTREECYMMDVVTRSSDEWSDSESDSPSIDAN